MPSDDARGDRRVLVAILVNGLLTVVQVVGGLLSGSLALLADALHNLSDAAALVIAFGARRIARRPSDSGMTFGYGRVEVVAALINYTTLIVIGLYLVAEAVARFFQPQAVEGWLVVVIAAVALVVDLLTALLTWALSKQSMNIRAAFLHNVADALGSVAVIVGGVLILWFDWWFVDPIITLLIAGYILWQSFREIGPVIRILMLGSPPDVATRDVLAGLRSVPGVADVHHAHFWQMQEHASALEAHLVIHVSDWGRADQIKAEAKRLLRRDFGIGHSTLELECSRHACDAVQEIGHRT